METTGKVGPPPGPPDEALIAYRRWCLAQGHGTRTVDKSIRMLHFFSRQFELSISRKDPDSDGVVQFIAERRELGVKPKTLNGYVRELNLWSRFCGLGWKMPYFRKHLTPILNVPDAELIRKLLSLRWSDPAADSRNRALLALFVDQGPRRQEVASMRLTDRIRTEKGPGIVIERGKGDKPRVLWISPEVDELLEEYVTRYRTRSHSSALFTTPRGALSYAYMGKIVREAGCRVGATWLSCHKLRHYCVDSLIDAGVSIPSVAEVMGHSRWDTVAIYRSRRLTVQKAEEEVRGSQASRFRAVALCAPEEELTLEGSNRPGSCAESSGSTGI